MLIQTLDLNFTQMRQPNTFIANSSLAAAKYCAESIDYLRALNLVERSCCNLFARANSPLVTTVAPSIN